MIDKNKITLECLDSAKQLANVLTKKVPLPPLVSMFCSKRNKEVRTMNFI